MNQPKAWFVTYGTVSFLVDARDAEEAEMRVRTDSFGKDFPGHWLKRRPVIRRGEVIVREATIDDIERHNSIKQARKAKSS